MREPVPLVRAARADDRATIDELLSVRNASLRGSEDHAKMVASEGGEWLLAEIDATVVGAACLALDRQPRPAVLCVVVHPGARGLGIGAALLDACRYLVRDRGGSRLDALALPGDRETKNLYERAGLTARLIVASGDA